MKIIGVSELDNLYNGGWEGKKYLVEITSSELCNLKGDKNQSYGSRFNVGDTINISELFNRLYDLKDRKDTLEATATQLEHIASLLRTENFVINELVTAPEKVKSVTEKLDGR